MARMYIESYNGERTVALTTGGRWFIFDHAPSGYFDTVDIMSGTEQDAANRMCRAIEWGALYTADDYANLVDVKGSAWLYIKAWDSMSAEDVIEYENLGRSCNLLTLTEICAGCMNDSSKRRAGMTNGDKIRAMTDEELAEFLDDVAGCGVCVLNGRGNCRHKCDCIQYIKKWIKQEVSEDA